MPFEKPLSLPRVSSAPENAKKKSQVREQKKNHPGCFHLPTIPPRSSMSLRSKTYLRIGPILGS